MGVMKAIKNWRKLGNISDDTSIIIVVSILFLICIVALWTVGVNGVRLNSYYANSFIYLASFVVIISIDVLYTLWISRPEKPVGFLMKYFTVANHGRRIVGALPMIAALMVFLPVFSAMKSSISLFNDYSWDVTLIRTDQVIHGTHPWKLLQIFLGFPAITSAISILYHVWVLIIYLGGIYFAMYEQNSILRQRYFVSFFAIWAVCGILLAIAFASVGPCFVGPLFDINVFDQQMAYLHMADQQFPVMVLEVQEHLLEWHRAGNHGLGRGITAMPSMHVALAFLFFLAMRHVSRWAGYLFGVFFVIVMIGSVHLAYHYAVDGYVAIAVTLLIWKLAGKWANWRATAGSAADSSKSGPLVLPTH